MEYTVLTPANSRQWHQYLSRAYAFDFYHSSQYHMLEKSGDPLMFVYEHDADFVAIPFIKRPIEGTDYFDLTSVYGYAGPVSNKEFTDDDAYFLANMQEAFLNFLDNERIVCLFSRLHPIIRQDNVVNRIGGLFPTGQTVTIDLEMSLDEQRMSYRENHTRNLTVLHQKGFYVKDESTPAGVKAFVPIYHENMRRVNATNSYFFDESYFNSLLSASEFSIYILLAYVNSTAVAGGVFSFAGDIIQVHLISTLTEYLRYSPAKLLVDEVSQIGRKFNMRYLHLGGGLGGRNDALFAWKAGFSNLYLDFNTWRYIHNQKIYNELTEAIQTDETLNADFFPLYRFVPAQLT